MDCNFIIGTYGELYAKAAKERDEQAAAIRRLRVRVAELERHNRKLVEQKGELINRVMRMEQADRERQKAERERDRVNSGYLEVTGRVRWVKEDG